MHPYQISYIISTYNRLPYLKETLEKLISEVKPEEEIVIVDGNSSDGTKAYLQQLYEEGKIHKFISEPDKNQAHGWNKAMLMAEGEFLKKIIDDDVFDYATIRKCAAYMRDYPQLDVLVSNDLSVNFLSPDNIVPNSRLAYFLDWKDGKTNCFTFSDVNIIIRRSSLSLIGLFNTSFTMLDWEYALRMTSYRVNLVYYTGYNALSVTTPQNITSLVSKETLKREGEIGKALYGYLGDSNDISYWSKFKIFVGKQLFSNAADAPSDLTLNPSQIKETYNHLYKKIEEINQTKPNEFINAFFNKGAN
jgi:glycosyltransferase involved in cell wall biosynthesis